MDTPPGSSNASMTPADRADASRRRQLVLAGQIAFLPTGILTTLLSPMLPILSKRWVLTDAQVGNFFPIQFLSQLAGVLLSGYMLARVGFRTVFLSGLLLMAAGTSTLFLGTMSLGMVSVAVYGLGLGLIIPTTNLMAAEVTTGSRAAAVSLLNFFWGVGAVLGSLLVAWASKTQHVPLFLGGVAVSLLVLAFAVRNLPFPPAHPTGESSLRWSAIARNPVTWLFAVVFFLYPGAETCVGGWIGSYVSQTGMGATAIAAMIPAFFYAALTAGRGVGGWLLRHFSERRVLQCGYAVATIGIGILLRSSTLMEVKVSAVLTGLSYATLYPITVARLSHRYGVEARSVGSLMFSLAAIGPAALPWLVGMVSQSAGSLRAGLLVPFVATAVLFFIHIKEW
ncbi:MAG: MFS transporter [Acidobacteria bacterium]|nr:MFS transporter [Acidobacteriota bacterium]